MARRTSKKDGKLNVAVGVREDYEVILRRNTAFLNKCEEQFRNKCAVLKAHATECIESHPSTLPSLRELESSVTEWFRAQQQRNDAMRETHDRWMIMTLQEITKLDYLAADHDENNYLVRSPFHVSSNLDDATRYEQSADNNASSTGSTKATGGGGGGGASTVNQ